MNRDPIERVYVTACRRDFHLARICIASIRYWYPAIPITLVPDFAMGAFDASSWRRDWRVDLFETGGVTFGWGYSKLELLFLPRRNRYLALDADIVMTGPLLQLLDATPGDFVVHPEDKPRVDLERDVFAVEPLARFDSSFSLPSFVFNAGQYAGTSGLLKREDFDPLIEWTSPRRPKHPEIFKCGDQGLLNYVISKAAAAGRLTIGQQNFFIWARGDTSAVKLPDVAARTSPPAILHWAGTKPDAIEQMERPDLLAFFSRYAANRLTLLGRWREMGQRHSLERWKAWVRRRRWLARCWLDGQPYAAGGPARAWLPIDLQNFHFPESNGEKTWRWSAPDAAITLPLKAGDYRVRIETGSPAPMMELAHANLCFLINNRPIPAERIRIVDGVAEVELDSPWLAKGGRQVLRWTLNRLIPTGSDHRSLGMPVAALWVFKRRRF